ncbi:hypothetical protein AB0N81_23080 [Streptomyces sp. NPDC093510]|uniref:hypothetical protein n=1 Tax=Streptomyces sp. NPDC093510 TaxID=3155199 RepID=UPI00341D83C8
MFTYSPYAGGCSVIGGHVHRGKKYADLAEGTTYLATDCCSSTVRALRPDGSGGYEQAEIGEIAEGDAPARRGNSSPPPRFLLHGDACVMGR